MRSQGKPLDIGHCCPHRVHCHTDTLTYFTHLLLVRQYFGDTLSCTNDQVQIYLDHIFDSDFFLTMQRKLWNLTSCEFQKVVNYDEVWWTLNDLFDIKRDCIVHVAPNHIHRILQGNIICFTCAFPATSSQNVTWSSVPIPKTSVAQWMAMTVFIVFRTN